MEKQEIRKNLEEYNKYFYEKSYLIFPQKAASVISWIVHLVFMLGALFLASTQYAETNDTLFVIVKKMFFSFFASGKSFVFFVLALLLVIVVPRILYKVLLLVFLNFAKPKEGTLPILKKDNCKAAEQIRESGKQIVDASELGCSTFFVSFVIVAIYCAAALEDIFGGCVLGIILGFLSLFMFGMPYPIGETVKEVEEEYKEFDEFWHEVDTGTRIPPRGPDDTGNYSSIKTCRDCKYYWTDVDLPCPVCTLNEFQFDSNNFEPCDEFIRK